MKLKYSVGAALVLVVIIVSGIFAAALITQEHNRGSHPAEDSPVKTGQAVTGDATFTAAQVAEHATRQDCWIIIAGQVYDVDGFIAEHPGGADVLAVQCGKDATQAFEQQGGEGTHSQAARGMLANYKVGSLGDAVAANPNGRQQPQQTPEQSAHELPDAVAQKYPNAEIKEFEAEDGNGRKFELTSNGQCREVRIDSAGAIIRDEPC